MGDRCPLFSLRSDANWGIGDFSDLAVLLGIARESGASVVAARATSRRAIRFEPLSALKPRFPEPGVY